MSCNNIWNPLDDGCLVGKGGPLDRNFGRGGAFWEGVRGAVAEPNGALNVFAEGRFLGTNGFAHQVGKSIIKEGLDILTVNPPVSALVLVVLFMALRK